MNVNQTENANMKMGMITTFLHILKENNNCMQVHTQDVCTYYKNDYNT